MIELLELLKDDSTTLVRRSVANDLNDIGKDHPSLLVEVCKRWMEKATPERVSLIRHALRSAVKRGDAAALGLLGFQSDPSLRVDAVTFEPAVAAIGGNVRITFSVTNTGEVAGSYNVDLKVHFVKASGSTSAKVFKVRQVELAPGESAALGKSISLAQHTTRTHYPGQHPVEVVINGSVQTLGYFEIAD